MPIHKAVSRSNPSIAIITELLEGYPESVQCADFKGMLPLHWLVSRPAPNINILQKLLRLYAVATERLDNDGMRPIDRFLMQDPRAPKVSAVSKIISATMHQREEIMDLLIHVDNFMSKDKKRQELEDAAFDAWIAGDGEDPYAAANVNALASAQNS